MAPACLQAMLYDLFDARPKGLLGCEGASAQADDWVVWGVQVQPRSQLS